VYTLDEGQYAVNAGFVIVLSGVGITCENGLAGEERKHAGDSPTPGIIHGRLWFLTSAISVPF